MWLVRTAGQWSPGRVADALRDALDGVITTSRVEARVPDTEEYEDMVMVRVQDRAAIERMRCLAAGDGGLSIAGFSMQVFRERAVPLQVVAVKRNRERSAASYLHLVERQLLFHVLHAHWNGCILVIQPGLDSFRLRKLPGDTGV